MKTSWWTRPQFWIMAALVVGLGLRTWHYLSDPPVWHDEAALLVNALHKNYAEHLGPLFYSEAAPPLFLWLERAVAQTLGDGTYAMRLAPWLASCASLLLMLLIGRRVLQPAGLCVLIGLFAVSDRLLWHACEAKPYALDVLLAALLVYVFIRWVVNGGERELPWVLFGLTVLAPVAIFVSFPACFLLGGAALVLLPPAWRSRGWWVKAEFVGFVAAVCVSFAVLYLGPIRAQRDERILDCWSWNFPHWDQPWMVPVQLAVKLTEVCRYACEPVGNVLSVFAVIGGISLWRQGRKSLLAFLLLPTALAAFAWLLGQYPLGPSRVMVFAAPALLMLIAAGVEAVVMIYAGLLDVPAPQGRQSMAWGVSPRNAVHQSIASPGGAKVFGSNLALSPLRGFVFLLPRFLGLTPQAIDCRPSGAFQRSATGLQNHRPALRLLLTFAILLLIYPALLAGYRVMVPWKRIDCARPAAFVLQQRQADEPVVGAMWEHQYYYRGLGADYRNIGLAPVEPRSLPATAPCVRDGWTLPPDAAPALWLVVNREAGTPASFLRNAVPSRDYRLLATWEFPGIAVAKAVRVAD